MSNLSTPEREGGGGGGRGRGGSDEVLDRETQLAKQSIQGLFSTLAQILYVRNWSWITPNFGFFNISLEL